MRDLFWVQNISEGRERLDVVDLEDHFSAKLVATLGFEKQQSGSRKFKASELYIVPAGISQRIEQLSQAMQSEIDKIAADLYSS